MKCEVQKVINYFAGAPVPKYLNKIPKDVKLLCLIYCTMNVKDYDIDYESSFYTIDYSFLNEYKNLKSVFIRNWGDEFVDDNIIYLLENKLLKFPNFLKSLCIYRHYKPFQCLSFLKEYDNLEFLIINTIFTKENIDYLPNNILYLEYEFNIEDVDNIIEALNGKFKNLKKIFLEDYYEKTPTSKIKFDELVNKLKLKNIEIVSNYDNFDLREFIMKLFEDEKTEVNYINVTRE